MGLLWNTSKQNKERKRACKGEDCDNTAYSLRHKDMNLENFCYCQPKAELQIKNNSFFFSITKPNRFKKKTKDESCLHIYQNLWLSEKKEKKKLEDGSLAASELIRNSITHRIKL